MNLLTRAKTLSLVVLSGSAVTPGLAQTGPVNGIRPAEVRVHAIVGATVVVGPGERLDNASIVIRDGLVFRCRCGNGVLFSIAGIIANITKGTSGRHGFPF